MEIVLSPCQTCPCPAHVFKVFYLFHNCHKTGNCFLTLPNVPLPSTFRNSKFSNVCQLKIGLAMHGESIFQRQSSIEKHIHYRQPLCNKGSLASPKWMFFLEKGGRGHFRSVYFGPKFWGICPKRGSYPIQNFIGNLRKLMHIYELSQKRPKNKKLSKTSIL